jgi:hypothetical protein
VGGTEDGGAVLYRIAAAVLALAVAGQVPEPTDADWRWLQEHRERAFEALMPLAASSRPLVAYRSHRDLYQDVHEQYFAIGWHGEGAFDRDRLEATVVVPITRSIQQQLLDTHRRDRLVPFESILAGIALRRVTIVARDCPVMRDRMDRLEKASLTVPDRGVIFMHPVVHRIVIGAIETSELLLACLPAHQAQPTRTGRTG